MMIFLLFPQTLHCGNEAFLPSFPPFSDVPFWNTLIQGLVPPVPVFCFLSSIYLLLLGELPVKRLPSSKLVPHGLFCSLCLSYVPLGTLGYISISDWKQWGLGVGAQGSHHHHRGPSSWEPGRGGGETGSSPFSIQTLPDSFCFQNSGSESCSRE